MKVIADPKTGHMRTIEGDDEDALRRETARVRREVRDVIAGNVQFHTDPMATPPPAPQGLPGVPFPVLAGDDDA